MDYIEIFYNPKPVAGRVRKASFSATVECLKNTRGALLRWKAGAPGRDFIKLVDEDDYIDVQVTCNASDTDAGRQLEVESEKVGVESNILT